MSVKVSSAAAVEIVDSRSRPTFATTITLDDGTVAPARRGGARGPSGCEHVLATDRGGQARGPAAGLGSVSGVGAPLPHGAA